jgi:hypothetical protein
MKDAEGHATRLNDDHRRLVPAEAADTRPGDDFGPRG